MSTFVARDPGGHRRMPTASCRGTDDNQEPRLRRDYSDPVGSDLAPVPMVVDSYSSFNGVVVDPVNDSGYAMS